MSLHNQIMSFITRFANAQDCLLNGCCYWFAYILKERFAEDADCTIMYNVLENHFATQIGAELYDVTGMVTSDHYIPWEKMPDYDASECKRIIRDCILLLDN